MNFSEEKNMKTILVVEDELSIRSFVCLNLKKKGYEVLEAESGEQALLLIKDSKIDIVLLDLMLPGINGFETCQQMRSISSSVGIIILTARTQEKDKIEGLIQGADDYVSKPFSMAELEARILSLLRRMNSFTLQREDNLILSGPFHLDLKNKKLSKNGEDIKLTPTEYSIIKLLINNKNQMVSRDELLDKVWGIEYAGDVKVVDVNVRRIRRRIEQDSSNPEYLCTVWGFGYIWKG